MPTVRCPKCQAENTYPVERAGKAMSCVKCGRAIPAQLTVAPTAKPQVRPPAGGEAAKTAEPAGERLSFADAAMGRLRKSSGTPWFGLIMVGVSAFVLLGGIFLALQSVQTGPPPEIKESLLPPAQMTQMIISYRPPDYVVGFTLLDSNRVEIARSGRVKLTVSEITHMGVQGVGSFENERKLYESSFLVNSSNFIWYTTGGLGFRPRRLICAVRVPADLLSRQPPDHAEGKVTARFYDGQHQDKMVGFFSKFFFPAPPKESAPAAEPAAAAPSGSK
jgi:hypothetical protein